MAVVGSRSLVARPGPEAPLTREAVGPCPQARLAASRHEATPVGHIVLHAHTRGKSELTAVASVAPAPASEWDGSPRSSVTRARFEPCIRRYGVIHMQLASPVYHAHVRCCSD